MTRTRIALAITTAALAITAASTQLATAAIKYHGIKY